MLIVLNNVCLKLKRILMEFQHELENFKIQNSLTKEKPKAIIEKACSGFIKRYRSRQNYCVRSFMNDLGGTNNQIHIYIQHLYGMLSQYSMFSQLDNLIRGIIDGQKHILSFLIQKVKDKAQYEQLLEEKVDNLTRKVYEKCGNCGESLQKKNIQKAKSNIDMGFKDPYTYFMMDLQEINRLQNEARLFLMKKNTELTALTEQQYIIKLQDMHENVQKTMYGIDRCLTDILKFQEKVYEMNDAHQEQNKATKITSAQLFNHKKFVFTMGSHFCNLITNLQKKLKNITTKVVYRINGESQTMETGDSQYGKQKFIKLKQEIIEMQAQNKSLRIHRNSLEQQLNQNKNRYHILEEQRNFLQKKLEVQMKKQSELTLLKIREQQQQQTEKKIFQKINRNKQCKNSINGGSIREEEEEEAEDENQSEENNDPNHHKPRQSDMVVRKRSQKATLVRSSQLSNLSNMNKTDKRQIFSKIQKDKKKNNTVVDYLGQTSERRKSKFIETKQDKFNDFLDKVVNNQICSSVSEIISKPNSNYPSKDTKKTLFKKQIRNSTQENEQSLIERLYEKSGLNIKKIYSKTKFVSKITEAIKSLSFSDSQGPQENKKSKKNRKKIKVAQQDRQNVKKNENDRQENQKSLLKNNRRKIQLEDLSNHKKGRKFDEIDRNSCKEDDIMNSKEYNASEKNQNNKNSRKSLDSIGFVKIPQLKKGVRKQNSSKLHLNFMQNKTVGHFRRLTSQNLLTDGEDKMRQFEDLQFTEKDFKIVFFSKEKFNCLNSEKGHRKTQSQLGKFEDGLNPSQINYMSQLFTYIANIHLHNCLGYDRIKSFLLNPNDYVFGEGKIQKLMKGSCSSLMREAVYKVIMMHRDCTVQGDFCRHLLYFMQKIRKYS